MGSPQSGSTYEEAAFERLKLEGFRLDSSTFTDCRFIRCSLVEAALDTCRFQRCTFIDCDLSLVQVPGSEFASVEFEGSKLVGVNWTMAYENRPTLGKPMAFASSNLSHCTFIGMEVTGLQMIDCVAHEVDFRQTDLQNAVFSGTDLRGSLFMDTDLSGADLRTARNYSIDPTKCKLSGAQLSMPEAISLLHTLDIRLDEDDDHRPDLL